MDQHERELTVIESVSDAPALKKFFAYAKLSGPGWLQGAITLGGGSLAGALYLGVVSGYDLLWVQPLAMICGIIMLSAITVGVWAMIFMTALTRGMVDQMISDGIKTLPGHVQMHAPKFRDDPNITNRISMSDEELQERYGDGDFVAWTSRVRVPAVITSERASRGLILLGIDPVAERRLTFVDEEEVRADFWKTATTAAL